MYYLPLRTPRQPSPHPPPLNSLFVIITALHAILIFIIGHHDPVVRNRILRWNALLTHFTFTFSQRHSSTLSAVIYDTHTLFTEVLDDPEKYGFKDNFSKCHAKECIWDDDLHPTFAMHEVVARDLARVLASGV